VQANVRERVRILRQHLVYLLRHNLCVQLFGLEACRSRLSLRCQARLLLVVLLVKQWILIGVVASDARIRRLSVRSIAPDKG
jgi:hypothetical protein